MVQFRLSAAIAIAMGVAMLTACTGGGNTTTPPTTTTAAGERAASSVGSADNAAAVPASSVSVLKALAHERTVGSARDPATGDLNPYGLDIAKVTSGKIQAGDLVVCDFNDSSNVQGTGTAILALHPALGSHPVHIASAASLTGCNALAMSPAGPIWNAAFSANDNPIVSGNGAVLTTLSQETWHHPFGQAFAPPLNASSVPAFYVSNAGDGSLVRVYVEPGPTFKFSTIVTGFPVNHGVPGSILGPSGLNYQPMNDRLYIVDGTNNALYAIDHISRIVSHGIAVNGFSFSGPQASAAHVIFHGHPLNGPISSALLFNGNIVLGNTLDPNGENLMVEISPTGQLLFVRNVDAGAAGSIFGMVASGTSLATTKLYFNDDNANSVIVLFP